MRVVTLLLLCLLTAGCRCGGSEGPAEPTPTGRCDADLRATGLFSNVGTSARAAALGPSDPAIGGESAEARAGDVLMENDRLRVAIAQSGRDFGPVPFGGWIVDADLKRPAGEPGRDQIGRLGLLYG